MDPLAIVVLFGLVAFGGICGAALLWALHARPLEKTVNSERERLREMDKAFAVHRNVYRIHYQILKREIDLLRSRPTVPPPARAP